MLMAATAGAAGAGQIELISRANPPAVTPSGPSSVGGLSADGRYVVFMSQAADLVPGQIDKPHQPADFSSHGSWDVFLRDRLTGKTTLVSHSSSSPVTGGQIGDGNDDSFYPAISADGRYVVFASKRANLVSGQSGSGRNLFVYDRLLNKTKLVSHRHGSPTAGADGSDILSTPVISADGRFIAYTINASGLDPGARTSGGLYLYDGRTEGNTLVYDHDVRWIRMSADGRFVVYYDFDFNIRLYDRVARATTLVSHAADSPLTPANDQSVFPEISADGNVIVFSSWATNLVPGQVDTSRTNDLFLYERASGRTLLLSRSAASPSYAANRESWEPSLSADGRWIAFYSEATDLVSGVTDTNDYYDIFLFDRISGAMTLVNHTSSSRSAAANRGALAPVISADGSTIAFSSGSSNLVQGQADSAPWWNVFLRDRQAGTTTLVGPFSRPGLPTHNLLSTRPRISADGHAAVFGSFSDLVPGDSNNEWDVYLYSTGQLPDDPGPSFPCALLDTRRSEDGPALRSSVRRILAVAGACGVPATAKLVTVQVTVLESTGKGNLRFYPGNRTVKPSVTLRFSKGATRSGTFTLPLATNGAGTLAILPFVAGNGTVHAIVEVSGYSE